MPETPPPVTPPPAAPPPAAPDPILELANRIERIERRVSEWTDPPPAVELKKLAYELADLRKLIPIPATPTDDSPSWLDWWGGK